MAVSSTTGGQLKYGLRNDSDGLRIVLPTSAFDKLIPSASTSVPSSSGSKHMPYDVFINHCGQDVKHTLASSIYNSLNATGLRVFLDKDELKHGDFFPKVLEEAMASASLHIAIFSEHYAESPWCLDELAFMLKTGTKIIPVFYHVQPPTLRWAIKGKGTYADALSKHERKSSNIGSHAWKRALQSASFWFGGITKNIGGEQEKKSRYTSEQLQHWKWALHQASFLIGDIINNQGDEQRVVKNVVNHVMKEMNKVQLEVAKHPVGLEEAVQNFDRIAVQSAGPIQIIGIWGLGGSGKTTLAKELYNKKCSTKDRSSFLFDLRDAAVNGRLHEKQKKLLEDLDFKDVFFDNVSAGKEILKSRLRSVPVLIVLDDVDHTDQLEALLPTKESLGQGSLIIVTTRDQNILASWDVSTIYKMPTLEATHAKQLFCWHAFLQSSPLPGFEGLVEKFLNACQGLPLSLKVLGGQLYGKSDKDYWQRTFNKFSQIPHKDIKEKLKISYDALEQQGKEMFLDTACFFIGERKSVAIAAWDASEWDGLLGWETLFNKCLVEVDKDGYIRMHDHLRDLGRDISNGQSPFRLWSPKQTIQIQSSQEAIQIRGIVNAIGNNCYAQQGNIIIQTNQGESSLAPRSLGLKIFAGNEDFLSEEHSEISRELVWLRCDQFQHKNIPSWLSLKKLRILELCNSWRLEDLWERDADAPLQLREMVIQRCDNLRRFPRSIGHLKNLKKILIRAERYFHFHTLSGLPQEFCHLQALEHLEIQWCKNLLSLPSNFGELTNLQHLNLNGCTKLKMLPYSFKKLALLEYLNLEGCGDLIIKSESHVLENMTKLRYLNLAGCMKLEELRLPNGTSLTELYLRGTSSKELPANIFQLTKLTKLEIGSEFFTTLPTSLGNLSSLTRLAIQGCKKLESLPDSLEHLNSLRDLEVGKSGVKCLPKSFIHLQSLTIDDIPISELSFGLGCMLKTIDIWGTEVSKISISGDCCPFLETLSLHRNKDLRELETLPATLKTIVVYGCNVLKDIRGVRGLKNLQKLDIENCEELDGLPSFAELVSLESFKLEGSNRVKKIIGLQELRSLRELRTGLDELPSLAELASLKLFKLQKCHKLEKIESLRCLKSLEELEISDCPELEVLPSLPEISSLKKFRLEKCHKLEKIEGLGNLSSLERLCISDCAVLNGLPSLSELTSLKEFNLRSCHKLQKIEGLESLRSMVRLDISNCAVLNGLSSLEELISLEIFYLRWCHKLEKIEGLERLRSLKTLRITDCPELNGLPSLEELISLEDFYLEMCHKLEKIEGLERLRSLEKLEVRTRWKAPCIVSLEQCERLKSLVVVTNDISDVEPFISKIQKWPSEVIICTRAVSDVGSLKNLFEELPNVSVLDYSEIQIDEYGVIRLRRPESSANANAILICYLIDCDYPDISFATYANTNSDAYFNTELSRGKWVWMGVFTQASYWFRSNQDNIFVTSTSGHDLRLGLGSSEDKVKVEEAWLVVGEKGSIREAFHQFFYKALL